MMLRVVFISSVQKELAEERQAVKDFLTANLPKLISGKLRITNAEKFVDEAGI